MRRRALLRGVGGGAGALALSSFGAVGVLADDRAAYAPTGKVDVRGSAEAVVGPDGKTAYVAAGDGFATVDVSDPANPTVLAEVRDVAGDRQAGPLTSILDVKVDGDRLLVSGPAQRGPLRGLVVYDVSDPANPTPATDFMETSYSIHNSFLKDGYAYLTRNRPPSRPSLQIVDVSKQTPEPVARWSPVDYDADVEGWDDLQFFPGTIHDMYVHDGIAYCAYWDAGTWMVDVSDPANPKYVNRVGDYSLERLVELTKNPQEFGQMFGEAPGNDHYVAVDDAGELMAVGAEAWDDKRTEGGGPGGIDLWDVSDLQNPKKLATIEPESAPDTSRAGTWTTSHNFDVHDGRLYSSWYQAGVKVHDLSDPSSPEQIAWWRKPEEATFWTAQMGRPGEFFVATTYGHQSPPGALYTFPDRAGQQENPPSLGGSGSTTTPTRTATRTETATATRTETATATRTETATGTRSGSTRTDDGSGGDGSGGNGSAGNGSAPNGSDDGSGQGLPGFGVGAALAGLGLGAYRLVRNRGDRGE